MFSLNPLVFLHYEEGQGDKSIPGMDLRDGQLPDQNRMSGRASEGGERGEAERESRSEIEVRDIFQPGVLDRRTSEIGPASKRS